MFQEIQAVYGINGIMSLANFDNCTDCACDDLYNEMTMTCFGKNNID